MPDGNLSCCSQLVSNRQNLSWTWLSLYSTTMDTQYTHTQTWHSTQQTAISPCEWGWINWRLFCDCWRDVANHLILAAMHSQQNWPPSLFALAFDNRLADRYAAFRILHVDDSATSCTNFVNFGPVTREIMRVCNFWCDFATIWQPTFIWHTGNSEWTALSQFQFQQINWQ